VLKLADSCGRAFQACYTEIDQDGLDMFLESSGMIGCISA